MPEITVYMISGVLGPGITELDGHELPLAFILPLTLPVVDTLLDRLTLVELLNQEYTELKICSPLPQLDFPQIALILEPEQFDKMFEDDGCVDLLVDGEKIFFVRELEGWLDLEVIEGEQADLEDSDPSDKARGEWKYYCDGSSPEVFFESHADNFNFGASNVNIRSAPVRKETLLELQKILQTEEAQQDAEPTPSAPLFNRLSQ